MTSLPAYLMHTVIRLTLGRKKLDTVAAIRAMVEGLKSQARDGVTVVKTHINGMHGVQINAEWLNPPNARPKSVILYLHGGGYVSGSLDSHRGLASQIAYESQMAVLLIDYRLAPEHPYPAALEDAVSGYRFLLNTGYVPENIVIAGDSAGGGLTLATLIKLRDDCYPMPAAGMVMSPFADLLTTGESMKTRAKQDPWIKPTDIALVVSEYAKDVAADHPYLSPMYGNYKGLSPLLIHVGDHEILLSDAQRVASNARAARVEVELKVWKHMWHVFHNFFQYVPEARAAIREMGAFARAHVGIERKTAPLSIPRTQSVREVA